MSADPHSAAVAPRAWAEDERARKRGRVQVFNATRPDGLDGWTIALEQYELLVDVILTTIDAFAADDGTVPLQVIVNEGQTRLGSHPAFPNGRLANYVRYTKVDLEARGLVERVPKSSPQRIGRFHEPSDQQ
ncbi:hypothetical protein [Arthrobacter sp. SX1312]|uniref:DUF6958 family protein n=1 Tax=Arthrobacter sp. SX1312 TaxID=2058896 RepID=UPI0011B0724C|nr:hypothetical protein [Arthrobacter sp. SX1312]